ncbi:MAG: restriction endonuclease subunit S, partial [Nanoarchaeota archaeon]|nr:restriction endonuclease subunit S [Nanoarchaeota archaeon]MBU1854429.1 restriction endonuclease subunit S [Nanoarchaeota archaeon]
LEIRKWKEFRISKVFKIIRGKRLVEIDRISGEVPYYSASDYNNGFTDKISNPLFVETNALIYTTFGKCYYVENEFTASDEISILKNDNLNLYTGLFIATIITQNKYKYTFGRKAFETRFSDDIIKLPVNKKNEIDYRFMEEYIKTLSYSSAL